LISRLEDLIYSSEFNISSFLGFLNEKEAALACSYLSNKNISYNVYGGYDNADRVYICLSSDCSESSYPITAISVRSKGKKALSHRDYLGSLMGIGLKRECIGDIIILNDTNAVVFVRDEISSYVISELTKVGNESVVVSEFYGNTDEFSNRIIEEQCIVTSMRVDNIISSIVNCSRSQATDLISNKMVFVNHCQVIKPSLILADSDIVSIRGKGKFIIGNILGKTKRERLILSISRYV